MTSKMSASIAVSAAESMFFVGKDFVIGGAVGIVPKKLMSPSVPHTFGKAHISESSHYQRLWAYTLVRVSQQ
jgi:hypothetical protein